MTKNDYYLHIVEGFVVAFQNYEIDKNVLPRGEKLIKVQTDNPTDYLGLHEKQIFLDPLPKVEHDVTDKESLDYRRQELKRLFYEIQFTKGILEDAKDLEILYDTKLREYNELKEPTPEK